MTAVENRGTRYPLVLPTVLRVSIAQILIALGTCALLEVVIVFRRQRVLVWPASALLTANGVAFVLRVPGTQDGQWWSLDGWWIFAATAAGSLLVARLEGMPRDTAGRPRPIAETVEVGQTLHGYRITRVRS